MSIARSESRPNQVTRGHGVAIRIFLLALAFALGTRAIGWIAAPIIGLVWGAMAGRERAPIDAMVGALLGWSGLLVLAAISGPVGEVARAVAGVMGVPPWLPVLATLLFGTALAWSACVVGREITRVLRATDAQPSRAP